MKLMTRFLWAWMLLGLAACGGGSDGGGFVFPAATTATTAYVLGKAHLELPVVGADVEFQDTKGAPLLGQAHGVTGKHGVFIVPFHPLHAARFRVAITGGTYDGKPFTDTLRLEVENFDPKQHLLYVNGVTTLVSHYAKQHPAVPLASASAKVLNFLQIPVTPRAAIAVANPYQTHFHHEAFLNAAKASGTRDLGGYMDALVPQAHVGAGPRSFARANVGGVADILAQFAENMVEKLGDSTFEWAFESILTTLGIGGNAEILRELHEINAKLTELQNDMKDLDQSLTEEKIKTLAVSLVGPIASIQSASDSFDALTQSAATECALDSQGRVLDATCPAKLKATKDGLVVLTHNLMTQIADGVNGLDAAVLRIQMLQLPGGTDPEGVLQLWAEYFDKPKLFDVSGADPRVVKIKEFYQTSQVVGTHLLIEAVMAQDTKLPALALKYADRLKAQMALQDAKAAHMYFTNPDVARDRASKLLWMRAPFSNMALPWDVSSRELYSYRSRLLCESLAHETYAGFTSWRLPTSDELTGLVNKEGSPVNGGRAGGGAYDWLIKQGFSSPWDTAWDTADRNVRAVVKDAVYFSSDAWGVPGLAHFNWALYDDRIDAACNNLGGTQCELGRRDQMTSRAGAWCVAEAPADAGGTAE